MKKKRTLTKEEAHFSHPIKWQQGATTIEYALILGCIFLVVFLALSNVGRSVKGKIESTLPGFEGA